VACLVQCAFNVLQVLLSFSLNDDDDDDDQVKMLKKNVRLDQVRCAGAHHHSQAFKQVRVNPIKLAYDTCQP